MTLRRLIFLTIALIVATGMAVLLARVLAPGGWTLAKALFFACFLGAAPWLGICAGNGILGFWLLVTQRDPPQAVLPPVITAAPNTPARLGTILAVTIRHESMALVLPPLRCLLDDLDRHGTPLPLFILSDTTDPALAAAEAQAVADFRAHDSQPARIGYRRRADTAGYKAGNVMEFLDHHAEGFDAAVMLDADSQMTAAAVLRLIAMMDANPGLGIVQHLTVGLPAASAYPRLFQFGMRAGMRVWATGQAWWQGDSGPYWGHNAIIRVAPFRAHCRLEPLRNGATILSHDQVEAARMRAAGWGVAVWAGEDGSAEANPPGLPEHMQRELRWLAGNLQYFFLLRLPGFRAMGRWQLVQAILLFTGAPLYTAMLALAAISAATGGAAGFPRGRAAMFAAAWALVIYAPKLLGYVDVLASPGHRARYGGAARFTAGILAEMVFTLLLDAISQPTKTLAMARLALGARAGWLPQNRHVRGVGWGEAARMLWPQTLFGMAVFALLAASSWGAVLWALPWAGGLVVAIPFCVVTSSAPLSGWLRRHRVAAIPEELPRDAISPAPPAAHWWFRPRRTARPRSP